MWDIEPLSSLVVSAVASAAYDGGKKLVSVLDRWARDGPRLERVALAVSRQFDEQLSAEIVRDLLAHENLVPILLAGPDRLGELLASVAAKRDVSVDDPARIAGVLLALVASSDRELAAQMQPAQFEALSQRFDESVGFVFQELLQPILELRQLLEPVASRETLLDNWLREAEATVVQSFVALGVPEEEAETLAANPRVGVHIAVRPGQVLVVRAVAGSGKSLAAVRTHQLDIVDAVLDTRAPLPVLLHCGQLERRSLRDAIVARAPSVDAPESTGVRLTLDGLDEVGLSEARRIVKESAVLARAWTGTSVVLFGRPDLKIDGANIADLPVQDESALDETIEIIVGRKAPFWNYPKSFRESIRLPLYAVAAAALLRSEQDVPRSRAGIIEGVLRACLRDEDVVDEQRFRSLAVETIERDSVTVSEIGRLAANELVQSRLILHVGDQLRFAVPVHAEWFAAQAILTDSTLRDRLAKTDASGLSRWRYALGLALEIGPAATVQDIAETLATRLPAGLRLVLRESSTSWPTGSKSPSEDAQLRLEGERALRAVYSTLRHVLASAAPVVGDSRASSVEVAAGRAVMTLRNRKGQEVKQCFTPVDGDDPVWAWRWTSKYLAEDLQTIVDGGMFRVKNSVAVAELAWSLGRLAADDHSLLHPPLDPAHLHRALPLSSAQADEEPMRIVGRSSHVWLPAGSAHLVRTAFASGLLDKAPLIRPWPVPDNTQSRSGWVDDLYSSETAAELIGSIRQSALAIYKEIVDSWLPDFAAFMPLRATMPVLNQCVFSPLSDSAYGATMSSQWIPLASGEPSTVSVVVGEYGFDLWDDDEIQQRWETANRNPPPFNRSYSASHGVIDGLFSNRPATAMAYRWIAEDLNALDWRDQMIGHRDRDW